MQLLTAVIAAAAAITGVLAGGAISLRNQRLQHNSTVRTTLYLEKQAACTDYLAASRKFRRYAMYSDIRAEEVHPTEQSKGTIIIEGGAEYQAAIDEAYARIMIVADSDAITEAALSLSRELGVLLRERVRKGKGMISNETVRASREEEMKFATLVRGELRKVQP